MKGPAGSIFLPVRNEERFLPAALGFLFRQTRDDWELADSRGPMKHLNC